MDQTQSAEIDAVRWHWFWRALIRLRVPTPLYYWLLDHLTDNDGWRPLHMRERKRLSRLPRWMHGAWAFVAGYFWLPCPDCDRMIGGHEDWMGVKPTDRPGVFKGVCRDCAANYTFGLHGWHVYPLPAADDL